MGKSDPDPTKAHGLRMYGAVSGGISVLCIVAILATYFSFTRLRRHPYNLVVFRVGCDIVFIVLLALVLWAHTQDHDDCVWWSLSIQFFGLAGQAWYFVAIMDIYFSAVNPFFNNRKLYTLYHAFVWGLSAISVVLMYKGKAYGISAFGMCWIRPNGRFNPWTWILFFVPVLVLFVASVAVWNAVHNKIGTAMTASVYSSSTRTRTLNFSKYYITWFGMYWAAVAVVYFVSFLLNFHSNILNGLVVAGLGISGVFDLITWWSSFESIGGIGVILKSNRKDPQLSRQREEDEADGNLQKALRMDIMQATSQGIFMSAHLGNYVPSQLQPSDYTEKKVWEKNAKTNPKQEIFYQLIDYAPKVFHLIRCRWGLTPEEYLKSFGSFGPENTGWRPFPMTERSSDGKSGAFFYLSRDARFVIKTTTRAENKTLRKILPLYFNHVMDNPHTFVCHFYGCHAISIHSRKIYFVVMNNVFPSLKVHEQFDLKGSWVNRQVMPRRASTHPFVSSPSLPPLPPNSPHTSPTPTPHTTMKDQDFVIRKSQSHWRLDLEEMRRVEMLSQLRDDCEFLQRCGIMDFSLLLGIHHADQSPSPAPSVASSAAFLSSSFPFETPPGANPPSLPQTSPKTPPSPPITTTNNNTNTNSNSNDDKRSLNNSAVQNHYNNNSWTSFNRAEDAINAGQTCVGSAPNSNIAIASRHAGATSEPLLVHSFGEDVHLVPVTRSSWLTKFRGRPLSSSFDISLHHAHAHDSEELHNIPTHVGSNPNHQLLQPLAPRTRNASTVKSVIPKLRSRTELLQHFSVSAPDATKSPPRARNSITRLDMDVVPLTDIWHRRYGGGTPSLDFVLHEQGSVYFMGVIDVLQEWNFAKRRERWFKTIVLRQEPRGVSAIAPSRYHERFLARMREVLDLSEFSISNSPRHTPAFPPDSQC